MKYEITPDLLTGNKLIDEEHRQLFDAVNKLLAAFSNKSASGQTEIMSSGNFLKNYVERHFKHEEELQTKYQWREFEVHHKFHEEYKEALAKIISTISQENITIQNMSDLNVHIVRLVTHIRTMDKRLGAYIQTQE